MPLPITVERSWAMVAFTGIGVRPSMNRITLDSASCWDTNGTPRELMLKASMDITSADTTTFTAPPTSRSTARSGLIRTTPRMFRPIMVPDAVAHGHQDDGGGHDGGQPPAGVINEAR